MRNREPVCMHAPDLPALICGGIEPARAAEIRRHAEACPSCAASLADYGKVFGLLQSARLDAPDGRFLQEVMAGIAEGRPSERRSLAVSLGAAAAACFLALILSAAAFDSGSSQGAKPAFPVPSGPTDYSREDETVGRALDWLASAQDPSGCWKPAMHGGRDQYAPGVTGLVLLAYFGSERNPFEGPHAGTVTRGLRYLKSMTGHDGGFQPKGPALVYNQALAAMSLTAASRFPESGVDASDAMRPLKFLASLQSESGGFGEDSLTSQPNSSASTWAVLALSGSGRTGWTEGAESARKAIAWMKGMFDDEGRLGYRVSGDYPFGRAALTAAGAMHLAGVERARGHGAGGGASVMDKVMADLAGKEAVPDFCQWVFAVSALEAAGIDRFRAASVSLKTRIASMQVKHGPQSGSWDPSDRWAAAGGRIYSTAMAALALETALLRGKL